MRTVLQVPMTSSLRKQAASAAEDLGFSSLQETVRLFLTQLAKKKLSFSFEPKATQLSPKAIKRYNKMIDDVESGKEKLFTANSVDELMDHLNKV